MNFSDQVRKVYLISGIFGYMSYLGMERSQGVMEGQKSCIFEFRRKSYKILSPLNPTVFE